MIYSKDLRFSGGIILGIITIMIGVMFVLIPYEELVSFLFTFVGICIMAINALPCFLNWMKYEATKQDLKDAIVSTISVLLGFIFIFCQGLARDIFSIIFALWLIILPIIRIVNSENKKEQFKKEIPYFLVGLLLFFVPTGAIFSIVLKIFGAIVILYGIINIVLTIVGHKNDNNDDNSNDNKFDKGDRIIIDAEYHDVN